MRGAVTENHSVIYYEEYGLHVAIFWFFKKIWRLGLYAISHFTNTVWIKYQLQSDQWIKMFFNVLTGVPKAIWLSMKYNGEYQEDILGLEMQRRISFLLIILGLHCGHVSFYISYLLIRDLWSLKHSFLNSTVNLAMLQSKSNLLLWLHWYNHTHIHITYTHLTAY